MTLTKTTTAKVAGVVAGVGLVLTVAFSFAPVAHAALTESQIQSILSLLQSFGADQSTIDNVDASLRGQPTTGTGSTGSTGSDSCSQFTRDLTLGSTGADVLALQKILNANGSPVAATGAGSPGNETDYFGSLTRSALAQWQATNGVAPAVGYFGPLTRAALASSGACGSGTTGGNNNGGSTTVPGTGLTVSTATQPQNSLAPAGAARVPFTKVTLSAGSDGPVTVNSVTVQRTGLGQNAAFAGVVLLDQDGKQLGNAKTLNSNDQATVGESVTIPAGQSRTFTVAGNMASSLTNYAGEAPALSVVAVNTSATVSGSLPITGAYHTINATLSIGSVTTAVSTFDPNTSQTKEIGSTGVRFAGIRVTAGSGEDIRIREIRWNQTGSAGSTDIGNVVTVVDGTQYPTTVSADGKYYTTTFGSGIVVTKGNNIDIYVKGDILGGSNRTVVFDIDKNTDLYITGETYGYGITAPVGSGTASASNSAFLAGTPWFDASHLTISAGSATTIQKSNSVAAQNISVNVPDQPLGGFETNIKGEAITITGLTLTVATSSGGTDGGPLTNVSIVDQNGSVVAGPVDANSAGTSIVFSDSITLPVGKTTYTVRGKVASNTSDGLTYTLSTVPSSTWTSPTGETTGDSITLSQGSFSMNTMTVKAAALDVSVSSNPVAQNIVAGVQGFTFANYQFDATQSGEDVRFSSMVADLEESGSFAGSPANLTNCQLFDGGTALNTGSNVVNPSTTATSSDDSNTFTFDQAFTVPKGTVKTLALKCNLASGADSNSTYQWGIRNTATNISVTGVTSSNSVTETVTASNGQVMTVATGSLVASEDSSSPSYAIAKSGSTGVTNGIINFRASNEDVTLQRIGLKLTNTASSSSSDLVRVTLHKASDGSQIGSAFFTGSNTNATSTLDTPLVIPKDTDVDVIVKLDLRSVGTSDSGTQGALIAVDVDTNSTNTQGVGSSGSTINASGSTSFSGTRMFSSYPTVAKLSGFSTSLATGTDVDLYRFSVTASAGGNGVGLKEVNVNIATSTGSAVSGTTTVTNLNVYAYTDANFSSPVSGFTNGMLLASDVAGLVSSGDNAVNFSSILQIPAGSTYYFRVVGDTTLTAGTGTFSGSVTTRISGDAAYPSMAATMGTLTTVQGDTNDDFVWSPNATTTSAAGHVDWTNGYFVPGLPSNGSDAVTISK